MTQWAEGRVMERGESLLAQLAVCYQSGALTAVEQWLILALRWFFIA